MSLRLANSIKLQTVHRRHADNVSALRLEFEAMVCGVCSEIVGGRQIEMPPVWSHVIAIGPLGSRLNEIEPNLRISLGSTIHTSLQRIDIAATALEHGFHGSGLTSWSPGLEGGNHSFSGWRDGDMTGQRDLPRRKFVSINLPVGAVVRANR
jgi:hypothetical protein